MIDFDPLSPVIVWPRPSCQPSDKDWAPFINDFDHNGELLSIDTRYVPTRERSPSSSNSGAAPLPLPEEQQAFPGASHHLLLPALCPGVAQGAWPVPFGTITRGCRDALHSIGAYACKGINLAAACRRSYHPLNGPSPFFTVAMASGLRMLPMTTLRAVGFTSRIFMSSRSPRMFFQAPRKES